MIAVDLLAAIVLDCETDDMAMTGIAPPSLRPCDVVGGAIRSSATTATTWSTKTRPLPPADIAALLLANTAPATLPTLLPDITSMITVHKLTHQPTDITDLNALGPLTTTDPTTGVQTVAGTWQPGATITLTDGSRHYWDGQAWQDGITPMVKPTAAQVGFEEPPGTEMHFRGSFNVLPGDLAELLTQPHPRSRTNCRKHVPARSVHHAR